MEGMVLFGLMDAYKTSVSDASAVKELSLMLRSSEAKIVRFRHFIEELEKHIVEYDFAKSFDFIGVSEVVTNAVSLSDELATMEEIRGRCSKMADRYGSKDAIERCDTIVGECCTTMGMADVERCLAAAKAHNDKMKTIEASFSDESKRREVALQMIKRNDSLLEGYTAYISDLEQYVAREIGNVQGLFPGLEKRIERFCIFAEFLQKIGDLLQSVAGYADRYGKSKLMADWDKAIANAKNTMTYADIDDQQAKISAFEQRIERLKQKFDKERVEMDAMLRDLQNNPTSVWSEDYDALVKLIGGMYDQRETLLTDGGIGFGRVMTMDKLFSEIAERKNARAEYVLHTESKYRWLGRKRLIGDNSYYYRYKDFSNSEISSLEYNRQVEELVKERRRNNWKKAAKTMKYVVIVAFFVVAIPIWIIMQFISSKDND